MKRMHAVVLIASLTLGFVGVRAVTGCTPQQTRAVFADLSKVGACVLTSVAEGAIEDPALILTRCEGSTFDIIKQVVSEWLGASVALPDAGNLQAASPLHVRFQLVLQRTQAALADGGK
jgi:hypothetical protein